MPKTPLSPALICRGRTRSSAVIIAPFDKQALRMLSTSRELATHDQQRLMRSRPCFRRPPPRPTQAPRRRALSSRPSILPLPSSMPSASFLIGRHEHHHTADQIDTALPRGNLIFLHAGLQALAWGLVFPIGMALGLKKSRWHVPCQVVGLCMTGAGYILGASAVSCLARRSC